MIVLDTHVLLWADSADRKLGKKCRQLIDKAWGTGSVAVPAIVFWEIGLLESRRRVRLPASAIDWRNDLLASGVVEIALDGVIALRALQLGELHADPADRFILATAIALNATLVTADERLLLWPSSLQRFDART